MRTHEPHTTFADIFLRGRLHHPGEDRGRSFGHGAQGDEESIIALPEIMFFPDPLYVVNTFDTGKCLLLAGGGGSSPGVVSEEGLLGFSQEHATWFAWDPDLAAVRARSQKFREAWLQAPEMDAFVNVASQPLRLRKEPLVAAQELLEVAAIYPGECVLVDPAAEDVLVNACFDRFVQVANRGWVLESVQGAVQLARLQDLDFQPHWYRVASTCCVQVRHAPTASDDLRTSWVMSPQEMAPVSLACSVQGRSYVQLADGRGWLFTRRPEAAEGDSSTHAVVMELCDSAPGGSKSSGENGTIVLDALCPQSTVDVVEMGSWTYIVGNQPLLALGNTRFGTEVPRGSVLKIDKRALASGIRDDIQEERWWLRIARDDRWVPLTGPDGKLLLREEGAERADAKSLRGNKPRKQPNFEPWMTGIV